MITRTFFATLATLVLTVSTTHAVTIDGFHAMPYRLHGNDPFSTVTITPTPVPAPPSSGALTPLPATVTVDDQYTIGPGGLNRHDLGWSDDGGITAHQFDLTTGSLDVSMDVTLTGGVNSPRKEAGFIFDHPTKGKGQFIVNTDANEIAAFAAPFPFYSFNLSQGISYTPGSTINMRIKYTAPVRDAGGTIVTSGMMEYIVDDGSPEAPYSSGDLVVDAFIEKSLFDQTSVVSYLQGDGASGSDYANVVFGNFKLDFVPGGNADFNGDLAVDGADYLAWQKGFGAAGGLTEGDADGNGFVDATDLKIWESQFGNLIPSAVGAAPVPEPATGLLAAVGLIVAAHPRRGKKR